MKFCRFALPFVFGLALSLALPIDAHAQSVGAGLRVRIDAPSTLRARAIGTVYQSPPGWISLSVGDGAARVDIPAADVQRLDVSVGRNRARGALVGAGALGLAGMIAGGIAGGRADGGGELEGLAAFVFGVAGLVTGVVIGGIGGAVWAPERWAAAPLFPSANGASPGANTPRIAIREGTSVRVTAVASPKRFKAVASGSDSGGVTAIVNGVSQHYGWSDVASIDVRGGRDRQRGAAIGAASGALLGIIPGAIDRHNGTITGADYARTIVGNAVVGVIFGTLFAPKGWQPLPIPR